MWPFGDARVKTGPEVARESGRGRPKVNIVKLVPITVLVAATLSLLALPVATAAEPTVVDFPKLNELRVKQVLEYSADEANDYRQFMDADGDGNVTQAEADEAMSFAETDDEDYEAMESDPRWDEKKPTRQTSRISQFTGIVGPVESNEPITQVFLLSYFYDGIEAKDEMTLVFPADDEGDFTETFDMEVMPPVGYVISSVQSDVEHEIAQDKGKVTYRDATGEKAATMVFVKQSADAAGKSPGPWMGLVMAAVVLGAAWSSRRGQ